MKKPVKKVTKNTKPLKKRPLIVPHRHTGRPIAREHTSYTLLAFITLCAGVLLLGITASANAALLTVQGAVYGVPPSAPATIMSPADGTHFTETPITVSGTCSADTIVRLYRNDVFSGESLCDGGNAFSIQTDLFVGGNTLQTHIFNLGENEGPPSTTIYVIYDIPVSAPLIVTQQQQAKQKPTVALLTQLFLTGDNQYQGYDVGDTADWQITISGGAGPYIVDLDWGDGTTDSMKRDIVGTFTISHVYKKPSSATGSFVTRATVHDSVGQTATLQLVTVVKNPKIATTTNTSEKTSEGSADLKTLELIKKQLILGWPLYIVTVLMLVSFWIGERRGSHQKPTRKFPNTLHHA